MALLLPDKIDDFVNLTLDRFKKKRWVDISLDYQHHIFASRTFQGQAKDPERGGVQLNWKLQTDNTGTFKDSAMFAVDQTGVKNLTIEAKQPWSKQTVNFSYDIHEDVFQSDMETIVRELEVREHSMYNDYFEGMEERLWGAPSSDTQDPRPPSGIPFWLQKNASDGFTGGNPSGFSSGAAGVNTTTYANWKNYVAGYTTVSRDDLVTKWRKACAYTKFQAPKQYAELQGKVRDSDYAFYTTWTVLEALEKILETRNDNLGVDLAKYMDSTVFKGNPVTWVPYLTENDTSNPVYGVNWRKTKYFYKKGAYMQRHKPIQAARQHTVREVHMDSWGNFACYDRRQGGFVLYVR